MTTFLVNAAWQITLVTALVALSRPLLKRIPARDQYLLLALALGLSLVLPLSTVRVSETGAAAELERAPSPPHFESSPGLELAPGLARALLVLYAISIIVFGGRLLFALSRTWNARRHARPRALPHAVQEALVRLCAERAPILWSSRTAGPAVVGGAIVLPDRLHDEEGSTPFWVAVLGHELAHLRRRDFEWNLLFEIVRVAIGFHPATHWLKRRLDQTRELACDESVSGRHVDSRSYARTLVAVAERMSPKARVEPAMSITSTKFLEARVMWLLDQERRNKHRWGPVLGLAMLAFVATMAANLAVVVRASGPPEEPPQAAGAFLTTSGSEAPEDAAIEAYGRQGQRDPFLAPTAEIQPDRGEGIGGFDVESLELRGIVETTKGFRAMVTGPDRKTYFLSGGERFFNGELVRIGADALAFRVRERDPLRRDLERDVLLRLHPEED